MYNVVYWYKKVYKIKRQSSARQSLALHLKIILKNTYTRFLITNFYSFI